MKDRTIPHSRNLTDSGRTSLGSGNTKFLLGGIIVALAVAYLVFSGTQGAMVYYLTVGEVKARGEQAGYVRVAGTVVDGSIVRDDKTTTVRFVIADGSETLPVVYNQVPPDAFKDGASVVVEGRMTPDGTFEAKQLLAKCPSKYESELK